MSNWGHWANEQLGVRRQEAGGEGGHEGGEGGEGGGGGEGSPPLLQPSINLSLRQEGKKGKEPR